MNKFLKDMAVLYDKLNKAEGFACVLVIQEIEDLYDKHKKELLGATCSAEVSSEKQTPIEQVNREMLVGRIKHLADEYWTMNMKEGKFEDNLKRILDNFHVRISLK